MQELESLLYYIIINIFKLHIVEQNNLWYLKKNHKECKTKLTVQ